MTKPPTVLPTPDNGDQRPAHFRRIGGDLRMAPKLGAWYNLDLDDLRTLLVEPGDDGVPGTNEVPRLKFGFDTYGHDPPPRFSGYRFEVQLVTGVHQVRYVRCAP